MIAMRDWTTPADADRIARDNKRRRQLTSLEFIGRGFNAIQNVEDHACIIARRDDLIGSRLLFKIHFQNWIKLVIWW